MDELSGTFSELLSGLSTWLFDPPKLILPLIVDVFILCLVAESYLELLIILCLQHMQSCFMILVTW